MFRAGFFASHHEFIANPWVIDVVIYAREGFGLQIIDNEIEANGCTGIGTEGTYPIHFPQRL